MSGEAGDRVGEVLGGRYELVEYVESGALGDIYKAVDQRLEYRQVAVKLLKPDTPDDQVARFKREALLTGGLSSPHIVKTSDFGQCPDGQAYLVMEWLRGQSLADLLANEGTLPLRRAIAIADGLLAGLEAAHEAGVVHRDMKPDNIFVVAEPGVQDHVKILDFGFAKVFRGQALDVTGDAQIVVGTVNYMAPEQLRGKPTDHRTDLYSVAAMLFRMLSGALPYETKGPTSTMVSSAAFRAIRLDRPPTDLSEAAPSLAELTTLEVLLRDNLSADPDRRASSAGVLRQTLDAATGATGSLPSQASQPGSGAQVWQGPKPSLHELPPAEPTLEMKRAAVVGQRATVLIAAVGGLLVGVAVAYFIWRATRA
jgi:eukaryotic-like serine/threonine-protein kinase